MNISRQSCFKSKIALLLLATEIIACATFATRQLTRLLIRNQDPPPLICLAILAFALLLGTAVAFLLARSATRLADRYSVSAELTFRKMALALTPALLLFLDFLPEAIILRKIASVLFFLALSGSLYLQAVFRYQLSRNFPRPERRLDRLANADRSQRHGILRLVFLASFATYSLILFNGILPPLPFSGDEPHYLLIAKSIVRDGDINLYNNYLQKDYWEFYPGEISRHAYPGKKGITHLYSEHFPALPLLLVPAYWCSDQLGKIIPILGINAPPERNIRILLARETMTLLTALLVTTFFLLAWELTGSLRVAFFSWLFFAFSLPILTYSQLLYSEIPVALILLLVLRQAAFKKLDSRKSLFWTGLGIAVLPWFGVKYVIPTAAAFVMVIYLNWKTSLKPRPRIFFLFGPLFISGALFFTFLLQLYGTISPLAVYVGVINSKAISFTHNISFHAQEFFSTGIAYFLDQRVGLFIYSPLYILFIPGIAFLIRRFKKEGFAFLLVAGTTWAFCTLTNFRGGYSPPGRSLLPIVPLLALFVSAAMAWAKNRAALHLFRILAILGILMVLLSLVQPQLFFHEGLSSASWNRDTQAHLLTHFSNAGIDFSRWVPNLIYLPKFSWITLCLWLAAVIGLSLAVLKKEPAPTSDRPARSMAGHMFWVLAFSVLLTAYHSINVHLDRRHSLTGPGYTAYFQDDNVYDGERGGFWTRGNCRTEVVVHSTARVNRLRLELSSRVPIRTLLKIGSTTIPVRLSAHDQFSTMLSISHHRGIPWENGTLYLLRFEIVNGFVPARVDQKSTDLRNLGLFVRIASQ